MQDSWQDGSTFSYKHKLPQNHPEAALSTDGYYFGGVYQTHNFASIDEITQERKKLMGLPRAEKFPMITWLTNNSNLECSMFVTNPSFTYNWVPIECDRKIDKAMFICEQTITPVETNIKVENYENGKNTTRLTTNSQNFTIGCLNMHGNKCFYMPKNNTSCSYKMNYVEGMCYSLRMTNLSVLTSLGAILPVSIDSSLDRYLTVWTLSHVDLQDNVDSVITVFYGRDPQSGTCSCLTSASIFFMEHKIWRNASCECKDSELIYHLRTTHPNNFTESCENDMQFKCIEGTCISNLYKCDGINDCLDTSDEHYCQHICSHR